MTVDGTGPLTTASGALAADSQDSAQAGAGGPALVEEQVLLEQLLLKQLLQEQVAPFGRECAVRVRAVGAGAGSLPRQRSSWRRAGRPAGPVRGIRARRPPPLRVPVLRCRR
ncbi:hypothetical protein ACGF4C_25535 [Streptomyces sp. NPDC048197]|uniref:hypothetical protein n=1 Tax=Streptomyces sp. NPDC048197 TaxID=3365511 RepID=UPI00372171F8